MGSIPQKTSRLAATVKNEAMSAGWVVVNSYRSRTSLYVEIERDDRRHAVRVSDHPPLPDFDGIDISPDGWSIQRFRRWMRARRVKRKRSFCTVNG